ncbi:MAG: helix-turn-helix domain-containing protein [Candidatus Omnitrophota bacterium]
MGFRIKQYAKEQGMKLGDVAQKLRMPLSNLSAVASGRRSVSLRLLNKIASVLNCSVPELFEVEKAKDAFKDTELNDRVSQIELENFTGCDKGWIHRLTFDQQKHFKMVREGGVPYGAKAAGDKDPWETLFECFNRKGVDYVVIGMSAINYYARSAMETFGTQDYDLFLRPAIANAVKAFEILCDLGYEMVAHGKVVSKNDLKGILKKKRTVLAVNPEGVTFELLFSVSGFVFEQMASDPSIFRSGGTVIRVAKLNKLLASKAAADRPKDRLFLKRYKMILENIARKKFKD